MSKSILIALSITILSFSLQAKEYLVKYDHQKSTKMMQMLIKDSERVRKDVIVLDLTGEQVDLVRSDSSVLHVEPNHKLELLNRPNDLKNAQWNMYSSNGNDMNTVPAWSITTGSKDIVVAVIDTGVDLRHRDLKDNLWVNEAEANGKKGVDDDGNGFIDDIHGFDFAFDDGDPQDSRGHGTHVSGTVGAVGDNGRGLVGVSWNVSLMALNMFPKYFEAKTDDAIRAIDYAIANGAHVINASWGATVKESDLDEYTLLKESIERAGAANVTFVTAAGNEGSNNDKVHMLPATFQLDNVISVGATNRRGNMASFSNYGKEKVHVMAPGREILSTRVRGGTTYMSGTSMAAPHIAGLAALMLSIDENLDPLSIRNILISSCDNNKKLNKKSQCNGQVDAAKALKLVSGR